MADDNIALIEFGAKIDRLIDGVNQIQSHIGGLKQHVEQIGEGFKKIAEIAGIAFSVEGIKRFIESMAELGLETERTMSMLGLSAQAVVDIGGVAKLTGTSMDGLALSLERMSLNIQRSTRDVFNPVAQGMKVLNLNAKELIGIPADQYLDKLRDAVSGLAPSLNLTNALMAVGGRGVAQMLPLLTQTREKYDEWKLAVTAARAGLADAVPGMAETHAKMSLLELSTQSLGAAMFTVFKPAIDGVVKSLTDFVQWLRDSATEGGALNGLMLTLNFSGKLVATTFTVVLGTIRGLGEAAVAVFRLASGEIEDFERNAALSAKNLEDIARQTKDNIAAIWAARIEVHPDAAKPQAGAIDEQMRLRIEMAVKESEHRINIAASTVDRIKVIDDLGVAVFGMSELAKTQHVAAESAKRDAITVAELQKQAALWPQGSKERLDAEIKLSEGITKIQIDQLKQSADILKERKKQFDDILMTPMLNSWDSHLRGLITGTEKFKAAWKLILGDMIIEWIKMLEKKAAAWASAVFVEVVATEGGEKAKTAAASEGMLARSAIAFAGALKSIGASIAEVFAKLTAWFATFMGPAAPAAAAGVAAGVSALAIGMIPAAASGAWEVKPGLFQLHAGEMVMPAGAAQAFRSMAETGSPGGGGGANVTFNISAWDGRDVHRAIPGLARLLKQHLSDNPSDRPRY